MSSSKNSNNKPAFNKNRDGKNKPNGADKDDDDDDDLNR
jgi:hypothetical protein